MVGKLSFEESVTVITYCMNMYFTGYVNVLKIEVMLKFNSRVWFLMYSRTLQIQARKPYIFSPEMNSELGTYLENSGLEISIAADKA